MLHIRGFAHVFPRRGCHLGFGCILVQAFDIGISSDQSEGQNITEAYL